MKHFFTVLLLTGSLATATTAAQAQKSISFGPRLGLNVSKFSTSGADSYFGNDNKYVTGVQVGGTLNIDLTDQLSFQPSLLFSQKGTEANETFIDDSNSPYVTTYKAVITPKLNYLELPLNLVYGVSGHEGFQLFAGPYVALGVGGGGTFKLDVSTNDPLLTGIGLQGSFPGSLKLSYGNQMSDNSGGTTSPSGTPVVPITVRQFDAGFNGGIGYRMGPFQAQLGFGLGLANLVPNDSDGNDTGGKAYNRGFQLAANYFFSSK